MSEEDLIVITTDNWEEQVKNSQVPVLVDFWAQWCGPCLMIAPALGELATELDGTLKIGRVNVDDNPQLAAQFNVMSIPMLLLFKNGAVQEQMVGAMPKSAIKDKLTPYI